MKPADQVRGIVGIDLSEYRLTSSGVSMNVFPPSTDLKMVL